MPVFVAGGGVYVCCLCVYINYIYILELHVSASLPNKQVNDANYKIWMEYFIAQTFTSLPHLTQAAHILTNAAR